MVQDVLASSSILFGDFYLTSKKGKVSPFFLPTLVRVLPINPMALVTLTLRDQTPEFFGGLKIHFTTLMGCGAFADIAFPW